MAAMALMFPIGDDATYHNVRVDSINFSSVAFCEMLLGKMRIFEST